jgi:tetratricopeptide (TPR) repeat protein
MVEAGYPTGSLAVAAIERGDWATAERLLTEDGQLSQNNPARLINLGRVYAETGRTSDALNMWRRALEAPVQSDVETADGRTSRTDEIARQAIARYRSRLQTASAVGSN